MKPELATALLPGVHAGGHRLQSRLVPLYFSVSRLLWCCQISRALNRLAFMLTNAGSVSAQLPSRMFHRPLYCTMQIYNNRKHLAFTLTDAMSFSDLLPFLLYFIDPCTPSPFAMQIYKGASTWQSR